MIILVKLIFKKINKLSALVCSPTVTDIRELFLNKDAWHMHGL